MEVSNLHLCVLSCAFVRIVTELIINLLLNIFIVYEEDGLYDDYPRYIERNKNNGLPFKTTVGAEFVYCRQIHSWVFRHPYITSHEHSKTSQLEENEVCCLIAHFVCSSNNFCFANTIYIIQNACSWLARSGETHDYDLLSVSKDDWQVWTGKVQTFELSIKCNDCFGYSDCNYHGTCNGDRRCECLDSVSTLDEHLFGFTTTCSLNLFRSSI